jgi:hypothetical protein
MLLIRHCVYFQDQYIFIHHCISDYILALSEDSDEEEAIDGGDERMYKRVQKGLVILLCHSIGNQCLTNNQELFVLLITFDEGHIIISLVITIQMLKHYIFVTFHVDYWK